MAAELTELCGDAADLIGYHLSPHGAMVHDDDLVAIVRRWNITYLGGVQLGVWHAGVVYLPPPMSDRSWIEFDSRLSWSPKHTALTVLAVVVVLAWLAAWLLMCFGVIDTHYQGRTVTQ